MHRNTCYFCGVDMPRSARIYLIPIPATGDYTPGKVCVADMPRFIRRGGIVR